MKPAVTVLIPSYNPGNYLLKALESVFEQTYTGWHVIVIDDASTDRSITEAGRFLQDPRVTLLCNKLNLGQSKCLNRGLALTDTPYAVQLDSDDWFSSDALEVLIGIAEASPPDIAVFSGNLRLVIEDKDGKMIKEEIWKNRSFQERYDFLAADCSQWPRFYRTAALKKVGGWPTDDPYEGRYMEDKRILLRLIEQYRFHWTDRLLYHHRRHRKNQTNLTDVYNAMQEWAVADALQRWGNEYRAVFKTDVFGRKKLAGLSPTD